MIVRDASAQDADAMSDVTVEIFAAGLRKEPGSVAFVRSRYLDDPQHLRCSVAEQDDRIIGFQSLKRAEPGNIYNTPAGWGIIGTHIRPSAARTGIGRRLFAASLQAAQDAALPRIEAYIAADNAPALAYYEAMGFRAWRTEEGVICKVFDL